MQGIPEANNDQHILGHTSANIEKPICKLHKGAKVIQDGAAVLDLAK